MSSPCSRLIRLSYARILCKLRTQPIGGRYWSSLTCVSVSTAVRSRSREERWGLFVCRNRCGGQPCQPVRQREGQCPGHAHCPGGDFWFRVGLNAMAVRSQKRWTKLSALPPSEAPGCSSANTACASCHQPGRRRDRPDHPSLHR